MASEGQGYAIAKHAPLAPHGLVYPVKPVQHCIAVEPPPAASSPASGEHVLMSSVLLPRAVRINGLSG